MAQQLGAPAAPAENLSLVQHPHGSSVPRAQTPCPDLHRYQVHVWLSKPKTQQNRTNALQVARTLVIPVLKRQRRADCHKFGVTNEYKGSLGSYLQK